MANNPLSNLSYTNKDFNAIFVEQLDLIKKLTYKWDPSISNESDPGVILLKVNAIIADKNNYNIDKNVLENFPETLTQDISARSLYKQLAYRMPWYTAATTDVIFKWVGTDSLELTDISSVTIPKFQMICDVDSEFVYTTLNDMTFSKNKTTNTVQCIEGTINTLTVNGQSIIELSNLDYHNRLYFDESNIAENGLFIYNADGNENDYWQAVDNLQVEPLGKKYYEFGIDSRRNLVYVEFPEDIHTLIGNGLVVKYILTNGSNGNIIARTLDRFYQDTTIDVNGEPTTLNSDIVQVTNPSATTNGYDPEDTETAYKHYRSTAGTFNTLVTLRDYANAIKNSTLVSNVKVCDRLNDVQSVYSIVTDDEFSTGDYTQVAQTDSSSYVGYIKLGVANETAPTFIDNKFFKYSQTNHTMEFATKSDFENDWQNCYVISEDVKEDLGAFDLKMYLLHSPGVISTLENYQSTFDVEESESNIARQVIGYIDYQKCVQHDFKDIIPNVPFLFKNSYPLDIKIIPHYKLSDEQIKELKVNINKALFALLNSSQLEFGIEAEYDVIYDTILNADERIKVLIMDDFTYTTFATYWDSNSKSFKDIPISESDSSYVKYVTSDDEIKAYKTLLSDYVYKHTYFIKDGIVYKYNTVSGVVEEYSDKIKDFRKDILTKSILAGTTPLYNQDNLFKYTIDQEYIDLKDTDRVSTKLVISPFGGLNVNNGKIRNTDVMKNNIAEYTLGANETLRLLAPSFITTTEYSNYVKFDLILSSGTKFQGHRDATLTYDDYNSHLTYFSNQIFWYDDNTDVTDTTSSVSKVDAKTMPLLLERLMNRANGVGTDNELHKGDEGYVTFEMVKSEFDSLWASNKIIVYWSAPTYRLPANVDYELGDNEYVVFYYKEEDNDSAPYTYVKYSQGTIIKPSFVVDAIGPDLQHNNLRTPLVDPSRLASKGTIPYSEVTSSDYQKIYNSYNYNDLSGSKTIAIRNMNQVSNKTEFKTKNKFIDVKAYYFITNNVEVKTNGTRCYSLTTDNNGKYILENDEYFMYINSDKSGFEMLGAGTVIEFAKQNKTGTDYEVEKNKTYEVKEVDYEKIATDGLTSFIDSCVELNGTYITLTEQQVYNFSEGDKVIITLSDTFDKTKTKQPVFTTDEYTIVKDYDVSYISGDTTESLPQIQVGGEQSSWIGKAVLNISCSYDVVQELSKNSEYVFKQFSYNEINDDGSKITKVHTPVSEPVYIMSSVLLDKVGGSNIDITYLDSYGKRSNPYLFVYNPINTYTTPQFIKGTDGSLTLNLYEVDGNSIVITNAHIYEENTYNVILPIRNLCDDVRCKLLDKNGVRLEVLNSKDEWLSKGTYYIKLPNDVDLKEITVRWEFDKEQSELSDKIVFNPLFKYTTFRYLDNDQTVEQRYGISESELIENIKRLDINGKFNYVHSVTTEKYIEDPLKSKSFFNTYHIFNEFTIPMADLYMSDRTQSNITLINNR